MAHFHLEHIKSLIYYAILLLTVFHENHLHRLYTYIDIHSKKAVQIQELNAPQRNVCVSVSCASRYMRNPRKQDTGLQQKSNNYYTIGSLIRRHQSTGMSGEYSSEQFVRPARRSRLLTLIRIQARVGLRRLQPS